MSEAQPFDQTFTAKCTLRCNSVGTTGSCAVENILSRVATLGLKKIRTHKIDRLVGDTEEPIRCLSLEPEQSCAAVKTVTVYFIPIK